MSISSKDTEHPVVALTSALLARCSVTPQDAGCQQLIAERLKSVGVHCEHLRFGAVDNLWATHGSGDPVLLLLGHTDVVPAGALDMWTSDPFKPTSDGMYLYGRGAADMKGGVAALVVAMERFVQQYPDHKGTLAFALTSDEEGEAKDGIRALAQHLKDKKQTIHWCITAEPTAQVRLGDVFRVGRRGSLSGHLVITGVQGHVAYPHNALNPIHRALPVLTELTQRKWDDGDAYFPPTSLQISNIHAGTGATNIIPARLEIAFNIRYNLAWNAARLEAAITSILHAHDIVFTLDWHRSGEPFYTPPGRLRDCARSVLQSVCGKNPEENTGGGTSDARFIAPLGAECIEIGPCNASIHQVNERVLLEDLRSMPDVYQKILEGMLLD